MHKYEIGQKVDFLPPPCGRASGPFKVIGFVAVPDGGGKTANYYFLRGVRGPVAECTIGPTSKPEAKPFE